MTVYSVPPIHAVEEPPLALADRLIASAARNGRQPLGVPHFGELGSGKERFFWQALSRSRRVEPVSLATPVELRVMRLAKLLEPMTDIGGPLRERLLELSANGNHAGDGASGEMANELANHRENFNSASLGQLLQEVHASVAERLLKTARQRGITVMAVPEEHADHLARMPNVEVIAPEDGREPEERAPPAQYEQLVKKLWEIAESHSP